MFELSDKIKMCTYIGPIGHPFCRISRVALIKGKWRQETNAVMLPVAVDDFFSLLVGSNRDSRSEKFMGLLRR